MANPFGVAPSPGGAIAELEARGSSRGLIWAAERFPWIHVESYSDKCEFGPLTSQAGQSGYESGFKLVRPIVTGVQVRKQGELGTTRRAIVNITAFSDDQLTALQGCYFIPGMSVRVQFGWSKSATGQVSPGPVTGAMKDNQAICAMNGIARGYPCYDGVQGMVAHFSYALTSQNTWECSVEIIAASEAVLDSRIDHNCCNCPTIAKTPQGKEVARKQSSLEAFFTHLAKKSSLAGNYGVVFSQPGAVWCEAEYEGTIRDADGANTGFWSNLFGDVQETYISYRALEVAINKLGLPSDGSENVLGQLKSEEIEIKQEGIFSIDPRVCLVNNASQLSILNGIEAGTCPAFGGKLDNIMINCIYLGQVFRNVFVNGSSGTLRQFLTDVLAGVNDACGSPWQFEIISTTEVCDGNKPPTITVIGHKGPLPSPLSIPATPNSSAVREFKLDLKLTDAMKTVALYSNRTVDTALGCTQADSCPEAAFTAFGIGPGNGKNKAMTQITTPPECPCQEVTDPEVVPEQKPTLADALKELADDVNDSTVSSAKSLLVDSYKSGGIKKDDCKGMILPFSFSFTCDGIGGFKFGQAISSNRIPSQVANAFIYQVTTVEHEVSAQDWTTTVSTAARYKGD